MHHIVRIFSMYDYYLSVSELKVPAATPPAVRLVVYLP